jgi:hypothetical protein
MATFTLDGRQVTAAEVEQAWNRDYPLRPAPTCVLACGCRVTAPRHGAVGKTCSTPGHGRQLIKSYDLAPEARQ